MLSDVNVFANIYITMKTRRGWRINVWYYVNCYSSSAIKSKAFLSKSSSFFSVSFLFHILKHSHSCNFLLPLQESELLINYYNCYHAIEGLVVEFHQNWQYFLIWTFRLNCIINARTLPAICNKFYHLLM